MKILIPNATGPTNFGDQAILYGLLEIIKFADPNAEVIVHSTDPQLYKLNSKDSLKESLFHFLFLRNKKNIVRLYFLINLFINIFLLKFLNKLTKKWTRNSIIKGSLNDLLTDYLTSDLIIFVGGGYLRSRRGLTQSLNFIMQLLMFMVAALLNKNRVVAPISFGPLAHNWQERLAAYVLSKFDLVALREPISYRLLKKLELKNIILSHDHAFLIKEGRIKKDKGRGIIGFTIRPWLDQKGQRKLEIVYSEVLASFYKKHKVEILPIIHVDSPDFPKESDSISVLKVCELLKKRGIKFKKPKKILSIEDSIRAYKGLDILIGMRMHSNILAATQHTPFVAVSYEHKTEGIMEQLGLSEYCVSCERVDAESLYKLLDNIFRNKKNFRIKLQEQIGKIQKKDLEQWENILKCYQSEMNYSTKKWVDEEKYGSVSFSLNEAPTGLRLPFSAKGDKFTK